MGETREAPPGNVKNGDVEREDRRRGRTVGYGCVKSEREPEKKKREVIAKEVTEVGEIVRRQQRTGEEGGLGREKERLARERRSEERD